jgi:hypothetical protein
MRLWVGGFAAALVLVAAAASAQSSGVKLGDALTGDAKAAYEAGKLLFVDGDFAGAEIKFNAAYDTSKDPRLLWNMAACEKSLRHYARTDVFVREYIDKGGALLTDQDRADAKTLLDLIDSFTVKLSINVNESGADVSVDDVAAGTSPLAKPVVVDIGTRRIVVHKDGFKPFEQQLPVGGAATAKLDVKLEVALHEGSLHITTSNADAAILVDGARVGVGRFDGKMRSGGHTLRITAEGMRPYQTEIVLNDDESRAIDIPALEKGPAPPKPKLWWPSAETAVAIGGGEKLNAGGAAFFDTRVQIGVHFGAPTELSLFVDVGSINPGSNNCGTNYHAPTATPNDLDVRYAFHSCLYAKSGLQFALHFTPRSKVDVWTSIDAGLSATFVNGTQFDPLTGKAAPISDDHSLLPGIEAGARLGVDYHPLKHAPVGERRTPTAARWAVGLFAAFTYTIIGNDRPDNFNNNGGSTPPTNNDNNHNGSFPWMLFGARTSLTF